MHHDTTPLNHHGHGHGSLFAASRLFVRVQGVMRRMDASCREELITLARFFHDADQEDSLLPKLERLTSDQEKALERITEKFAEFAGPEMMAELVILMASHYHGHFSTLVQLVSFPMFRNAMDRVNGYIHTAAGKLADDATGKLVESLRESDQWQQRLAAEGLEGGRKALKWTAQGFSKVQGMVFNRLDNGAKRALHEAISHDALKPAFAFAFGQLATIFYSSHMQHDQLSQTDRLLLDRKRQLKAMKDNVVAVRSGKFTVDTLLGLVNYVERLSELEESGVALEKAEAELKAAVENSILPNFDTLFRQAQGGGKNYSQGRGR